MSIEAVLSRVSPKADFYLCLYAKISLPTHAEMSKVSGSVRVYAKFLREGNRILVFRPFKLFFKYYNFNVFCPLHNSMSVFILIFCIAYMVKSISNQCVKSSCQNIACESCSVHFCIADLVKIRKSSKSFCIEPKLSPVETIYTS